MSVYRTSGATVLLVAASVPDPVAAIDPGRADLLAQEATRLAGASTGLHVSPWMLVLFCLGTLVAAFCGSYFGLWRPTIGSVRDKDGWREVTYRFRSSSPLKISGHMLNRMTGVLGEIEDLGSRIRELTPGGGPAQGRPRPPSRESGRDRPARPAEDREPVRFSREIVEPLTASPAPAAPEVPPTAAPERKGRRADGADERRATVMRARRLLEQGHDPATVREVTGLNLAELDMIRWSPTPSGRQGAA